MERAELDFDAVIGHEAAIRQLRRAVEHERVAHAYLFIGPEGVGKRRVAFAFAAALLGRGRGDASYRKIAAGNHPDFHLIDAEPKERFIKKAAIDQMIAKTAFAPFESEWKAFVILGAERMNLAAANALLKTLEEPTRNTVIILVTSAPQALLQTILSRCQKILFGPLSDEAVAEVLVAQKEMPRDDALWIARMAQGSLGRALTADLASAREARRELGAAFFGLRGQGDRAMLDFAQRLVDWPEGTYEAFEIVKTLVADAVRLRATGARNRVLNTDLVEPAGRFAEGYDIESLSSKIRTVVHAQQMLKRNANASLTAEAMLTDILARYKTGWAERIPLT